MKPFLRRPRRIIERPVRIELPSEIHLPALGETRTVKYRPTGSRTVRARGNGRGELAVTGRIGDKVEVLKALRRWLMREARAALVPWLDELSTRAGLSYGSVAIRGQRTRWASCSSRGDINLNFRLLFLPPDVVRYILNHELCHTVHLNHSRTFWANLALLEPDFRMFNSMSKRGMEEVPEWAKYQFY